jgi:hypothetical protein
LVAWIWDMEVTLYVYVFTPDYTTAQQSWHWGRHQLCPVGLATASSPGLRRSGTCPYSRLSWPCTSRHTSLLLRQRELFTQTLDGRRPFSLEFTAPADCSSRELRPRKSSDLGRRDVALAPRDVFITNVHYLLSSFCSCWPCLGHTGIIGPGF